MSRRVKLTAHMSGAQLRSVCNSAGAWFNRTRCAELSGVSLAQFKKWWNEEEQMPPGASALLCMHLYLLGHPMPWVGPWIRPEVLRQLHGVRKMTSLARAARDELARWDDLEFSP
jgi:hypothetical protein